MAPKTIHIPSFYVSDTNLGMWLLSSQCGRVGDSIERGQYEEFTGPYMLNFAPVIGRTCRHCVKAYARFYDTPPVERKPISKRLRFEIFKRDGFRCVYCAATPVQSPLHIDHVVAVADGGDNKPENLVTACESCNLGKSAVSLDHKALSGKRTTQADLDHVAQIKEYLAVQKEIAKSKNAVADELHEYWIKAAENTGGIPREIIPRLRGLAEQWPLNKLMEAVDITCAKEFWSATTEIKYFYGILRRWRSESEK